MTLLPALQGEEWEGRDFVYAEQARDGILTDTAFMTMVRDHNWKLVHFLDEDDGQLFDLQNDPEEVRNLWLDPASESEKRRMLAELREWRIRSGVQSADWSADWR